MAEEPEKRMTVRPLERRDQATLEEMLYLALWTPPGALVFPREITREPKLAQYFQAWGCRPGDLGLVAEENGPVVGAAWLRHLPGGYGRVRDGVPELSVAVVPGARGRGVGTRLLQELFGLADDRFPAFSLSVSRDNPAVRLYERLGFAMHGRNGDSLVMLRERDRLHDQTGGRM